MGDLFICAACGNTYSKAWSDEEAEAEKNRDFPHETDLVTVCEDCYQQMKEDNDG